MRRIQLTRGQIALVDNDDYAMVSAVKWYASRNRDRWYAANRAGPRKAHVTIYLHRLIMNAPSGVEVDHIDGNSLNCQRSNLRLASRSQNACNTGIRANNKSGFKGVSWHERAGRWQVSIHDGDKIVYLGLFDSSLEGAKAYDAAAMKYHGEFARTNIK